MLSIVFRAMAVTLNQLSSFLAVAREGSVSARGREALRHAAVDLGRRVGALARARRRPDRARRARRRPDRRRRGVPALRGRRARPDRAGPAGRARGGRRLDAQPAPRRRRDRGRVRRARRSCAPSPRSTPRSTSRSRSRTAPRVFERVLEHEVDVAIAGRPPEDERIAGIAFLTNELALIVAPDDALAGARAGRAATSSPTASG